MRLLSISLACMTAALFGCAASDDEVEHAAVDGDADDDPTDDPTDDSTEPEGCAAETRDDDYMLGLERAGAAVAVRFVDAMPAPPARFDNTWILDVVDVQTGEPLEDVELTVEPYMPDHNHGTSIACEVEKMAEPGRVMLEPVNLFMPGLWEVRLHFTLASGTKDDVTFRFCVDP